MSFDPFGDFETRGYLRNSEGLTDPAEIKALEHACFLEKLPEAVAYLRQAPHLSYEEVLETHKILFRDVYPWAGQDRAATAPDIAVAKSGRHDLFAHPKDARAAVEYAVRLGQDRTVMAERPGEIMGYLAHGHPFLEGNGRTLMLVHNELAHRAGIGLDWAGTNRDAYLQALTRELERPGKGELDAYLKPFVGRARSREETAVSLATVRGLGPEPGVGTEAALEKIRARRHENDAVDAKRAEDREAGRRPGRSR